MKRFMFAAACLLACGALVAGVFWWTRPAAATSDPLPSPTRPARDGRTPTVYALLVLERGDGPLPAGTDTAECRDDLAVRQQTAAALLKSRGVLAAALRDAAVAKLPLVKQQRDAPAWLEGTLQVDFPGDSAVVRVGITGSPAHELAAVVNAVVLAYRGEARQRQLDTLRDYERAYASREEKLMVMRAQRHRLEEALKIPDPRMAAALQQALTECVRERRGLRVERTALEALLRRRRAAQGGPVAPGVAQLEDQLAVLDAKARALDEEKKELEMQNRHSMELELRRQEIEEAEKVLRRLRAGQERLRVNIEAGSWGGRTLAPAVAPASK